jgi:phosphoglycerate dehydrogenase-like enzyme
MPGRSVNATGETTMRAAILDDYSKVALQMADWQSLAPRVTAEALHEHLGDAETVVRRLRGFDIIVAMRERTPLPRAVIEQLPDLKLIITSGMRNASIDGEAAAAHGIQVCGTEMLGFPTAELTWGFVISLFRGVWRETEAMRGGGWQIGLGRTLKGKTIGILGLGKLGSQVAGYAKVFGMDVIAWSQNLTAEKAEAAGAKLVDKDELFRRADLVTIHLVLSDRSRGLVGAREFGLMKETAFLVNTSRGPIVDEKALLDALRTKRIAAAAIDVYDREPLAADHPIRKLDNALVTPHIGYVTEEAYRLAYGQAVEGIRAFLDGKPVRPLNQPKAR